jgi:hypothetical protein
METFKAQLAQPFHHGLRRKIVACIFNFQNLPVQAASLLCCVYTTSSVLSRRRYRLGYDGGAKKVAITDEFANCAYRMHSLVWTVLRNIARCNEYRTTSSLFHSLQSLDSSFSEWLSRLDYS